MPPLESIEPPLFEVEGDRTVSRDAFDLPPSNSPIHESPTVARSEPRTTIGSARSAWMFGRRNHEPLPGQLAARRPWSLHGLSWRRPERLRPSPPFSVRLSEAAAVLRVGRVHAS